MKNNKKLISGVFSILVFCILLASCSFNKNNENSNSNNTNTKENCPIELKEEIVNGSSLEGLIEDGTTVKVQYGYYKCNEVNRDDIVIYSYAGNKNPLIKVVKGIPGDNFSLNASGNKWNIKINDQILLNSESKPYELDNKSYKMLSLYENEYKGLIPENTYLILGNLTQGTMDSSRFGLIDIQDILGKAEKK